MANKLFEWPYHRITEREKQQITLSNALVKAKQDAHIEFVLLRGGGTTVLEFERIQMALSAAQAAYDDWNFLNGITP